MARRVFFSFDYDDVWRASQVRNSWVTQEREAAGFWDAASWEKVKKQGDAAIERWIGTQMQGTSVTAVLIGSKTAYSKWVQYEIKKSHEVGKGILGVYIHGMKNQLGFTSVKGPNPLDMIYTDGIGLLSIKIPLSRSYNTYDWIQDSGYVNFSSWVERAAKAAGR